MVSACGAACRCFRTRTFVRRRKKRLIVQLPAATASPWTIPLRDCSLLKVREPLVASEVEWRSCAEAVGVLFRVVDDQALVHRAGMRVSGQGGEFGNES